MRADKPTLTATLRTVRLVLQCTHLYQCLCWSCRYYTGEGWVPKKLDVLVEAPDSLDLEHLRAKGLQPGTHTYFARMQDCD